MYSKRCTVQSSIDILYYYRIKHYVNRLLDINANNAQLLWSWLLRTVLHLLYPFSALSLAAMPLLSYWFQDPHPKTGGWMSSDMYSGVCLLYPLHCHCSQPLQCSLPASRFWSGIFLTLKRTPASSTHYATTFEEYSVCTPDSVNRVVV